MIKENIVIGAGSEFPLNGLLILPDDLTQAVPAVVMVHGSGPSNMDERVMKLTPFKDLAEGLAKQISAIGDDNSSKELQTRLLYNTVMLSENNPGELIKNFNRPDNPLLDVLNQSSRFAEAIEKLSRVPGLSRLFQMADSRQKKKEKLAAELEESIEASES